MQVPIEGQSLHQTHSKHRASRMPREYTHNVAKHYLHLWLSSGWRLWNRLGQVLQAMDRRSSDCPVELRRPRWTVMWSTWTSANNRQASQLIRTPASGGRM